MNHEHTEHEHTEREHTEHEMHEHGGHEHHEHHPVSTGSTTDSHEHGGHDHGGHGDHSHHDPAIFRRLFWVNLALTIPTLVFSTGLQDILGLDGPRFAGSQFIPAVFGILIFLIGGRVFLSGAVSELRAKSPGMMTLISLALVVAFGYSLAVTIGLPGMDFWWELATLTTIMLLGHWIEMSAVMGAQNALGELAKLLPDEAQLQHGDHVMTVPASQLKVGDIVIVRPGAAIPTDGEVVDGTSEVDESLLTGESVPVRKQLGASVVGGSISTSGALTVRVTKVGDETALAGVMRLVADAQASKGRAQLLADRAAAILFYVAIAAALITLVAWVILKPGDPAFVLERVVTVLVIACPHALGLAIPLVASLSTAIGARRGILVRSRAALEQARDVDVVLFDKTGTLTEGRQRVARQVDAVGTDRAENGALAAAVEARSEHPIARAIAESASGGSRIPESTDFESLAGRGVSARVEGRSLTVASQRLVAERGIQLEAGMVSQARAAGEAGETLVYLIDDGKALAMFGIADVIRPESVEAVQLLRKRGVRVAMLTGDSHAVAAHVAEQLGITEVFAEVLPGEKADVVAKLQAEGAKRVAMVGDGINDAPALVRADLGIAIGAGTDVAIESAGVVLASSDPRGVADTITLSRASYRKMLQNLAWATGYNAIGLPVAAGVLAGVGFLMPPAVGAAVMSVSTIVVALNAQLLRRIRFSR
jgi:Cu2+-exporting ATPase